MLKLTTTTSPDFRTDSVYSGHREIGLFEQLFVITENFLEMYVLG